MSKQEWFKQFLTERLTAAALEIFGAFEETIADYQGEISRFQGEISRSSEENARLQRLLNAAPSEKLTSQRADVQQPTLPEPPEIKEEQELWTIQGEDSSQLLLIYQTPTVENSGDSLPMNTTDQIKAEPDEEDYGAPEPASDSPPDRPRAQSLEERGRRCTPTQDKTNVHNNSKKAPPAKLTLNELFASLEAEFEPEDVPADELSEDQGSDTHPHNPEEELGYNQNLKMGKPCGPTCRKKCWSKITEERRETVYAKYCKMTKQGKKLFIFTRVSQRLIKRHSSAAPSRRSKTLTYHLTNELGQSLEVCKTFFLTTLGYHPKNDRLIQTVIRNCSPSDLTPSKEHSGRHAPANKIHLTPIYKHIESFNPLMSTFLK